MRPYKCLIIDDEPLAIDVIVNFLNQLPHFVVQGTFTDPVAAFVKLKSDPVDLLFIDIQMPDFTGLDFIRALESKPEIIVTTAYRNYAVEGYDLNVLDYLVKPIPFDRFMQCINKFLSKKGNNVKNDGILQDFIVVRDNRKNIKIELEDILYVKGVKDYVKIVLSDGNVMTKLSVGNFYNQLKNPNFIRIHKSYIVNLDKITAYTHHDVEIDKIEIPIGKTYREQFENALNLR